MPSTRACRRPARCCWSRSCGCKITTPEEYLGDFVGDLQQRRAIITAPAHRGRNVVIDAEAPLANLFGYSSAMRRLEPGPGDLLDGAAAYGPAPPECAKDFM